MQFLPYSIIRDASQYQEDVIRLLYVLNCSQPDSKITFAQLASALLATGLSPRLLYEHASAGHYTEAMARLDEALGLPTKPISYVEVAPFGMEEYEHIMQRLIDANKEEVSAPVQEVKVKQKVPYYQKNKDKWWK